MKRTVFLLGCILVSIFLLSWLLLPSLALARPTTAEQSQRVVKNWLSLVPEHLGMKLSREIKEVRTFKDDSGNPLYYVVFLEPAGIVIVPGDDLVEPIIAFLPGGDYDPSVNNPLGALVSRDLPGRVTKVRELQAVAQAQGQEFTPFGFLQKAQEKWGLLDKDTPPQVSELGEMGLPSISDIRVPPLLQTTWDQGNVGSNHCYNYYTPYNYPSGCVATAMAQLMRYHQYPSSGPATTGPFTIHVNGSPYTAYLRGGNGSGGPYSWAQMPFSPNNSTPVDQLQAIGDLTYDAGVSVNMSYTASSSGTDTLLAADRLKFVFRYSNAVRGFNNGGNIDSGSLDNMIAPNLYAGLPVLLGITGPPGGHAIVADGRGAELQTWYYHLNMGWSGVYNAWYNLPNIDSNPAFTTVYKCVYNVYPSGTGEIISGRVTYANGNTISGASVIATRTGGGTYNAVTNNLGNYTLTHLPSNSSYTINASTFGYTFQALTVNTGTSTDNSASCGNVRAVNFTGKLNIGVPWIQTGKLNKNGKLKQTGRFKRGNMVWIQYEARDYHSPANLIPEAWVTINITGPGGLVTGGTFETDSYGSCLLYYQSSKGDLKGDYSVKVVGLVPPDPNTQIWDNWETVAYFRLN